MLDLTSDQTALLLLTAKMRIAMRAAGGVGSGDKGHAGRKGEVGGSGAGTGGDKNQLPKREVPTIVSSVKEAIPLILAGHVVELKNPSKVNSLMLKLAAIGKDAIKKGDKAPNYDACNISVSGHSYFCGNQIQTKEYPNGMPRVVMPQFGGEPIKGSAADKLPKDESGRVDAGPEFLAHLESLGIKSEDVNPRASSLMASQAQLVGSVIAKRAAKDEYTPSSPIFISRDNYIVDGHHRWAAVVARDAGDGKDLKIRAIKIDAPISEVLKIGKAWSAKFGIKQASA